MVFVLYYGFATWIVCERDGSIRDSFASYYDAMLNADLTNWIRFVA